MRRVILDEFGQEDTPYKKPRDASLVKKRRERVREACPIDGFRLYEFLSERANNRKWRYLCMIKSSSQNTVVGTPGMIPSGWGWAFTPTPSRQDDWRFRPENNDETSEEARALRDIGIGKMYFSRPWFALVEPKGIMIGRLALGENLVFIYDIHKNNIILDHRVALFQLPHV